MDLQGAGEEEGKEEGAAACLNVSVERIKAELLPVKRREQRLFRSHLQRSVFLCQVRCRAMSFHLMAEFGRRHGLFPGHPLPVGACERLARCFAWTLSRPIPWWLIICVLGPNLKMEPMEVLVEKFLACAYHIFILKSHMVPVKVCGRPLASALVRKTESKKLRLAGS